MQDEKLIAMLPKLVENAYEAGFLKCFELIRKLPEISYTQATKIYGPKKMNFWTEHKQIHHVRSGKNNNSTIKLKIYDLEMLDQREQILDFINL